MFWQLAYFCIILYLLFDQYEVIMDKCFFTRQEIAAELGIDPKTLRRKLEKAGIMLDKGLIPTEMLKEIKLRLQVEMQNHDEDGSQNQPHQRKTRTDKGQHKLKG